MARRAWMESSLQRSGRLGLEVLQRASRRSVDWTKSGACQSPSTYDNAHIRVKSPQIELQKSFATISEFMAQTTFHCKNFYDSGPCMEHSDTEKMHISRFHTQPQTERRPASTLPTTNHDPDSGEDFYIELSPGTYAVTARLPDSQQQTHLITVKAGESVQITFDL